MPSHELRDRPASKLQRLFGSFWSLQLVGWAVYGVLIYITFLTVVPPQGRFNLLLVKVSRTVAGFVLTCVMRVLYKRVGNNRPLTTVTAIILVGSIAFGSLWPFGEAIGLWLMRFRFAIDWNGYPIEVLDYTSTLIGWSALYFGIKYWKEWQAERDRTLQAQALAHHAQLDMLRYQLNPHFLFNALNSIRASIDEDSRRAKQMVTEFSEFLRYSLLNDNSGMVTLRDEIEAVKNYLAIEKIRFEEKLQVEFDVESEAETFKLPSFLVHPLVENAVKHGLTSSATPLEIKIVARMQHGNLVVEVANTGRMQPKSDNGSGTKIGLSNVRERLDKVYPAMSSFTLREADGWIRARIEIRS